MKRYALFTAVITSLFISAPAQAQELLATYTAYLSRNDHHNSYGERLRSVAAIIRQDRANYHRFNVRDPEDKWDPFFAKVRNRNLLEQWLRNGHMSGNTRNRILYGNPVITVRVYGYDGVGEYIRVTVE